MTTYSKPIKCPECGQETYELYHAVENRVFEDKPAEQLEDFHFMLMQCVPQKVLMCDACYENSESEEGLKRLED